MATAPEPMAMTHQLMAVLNRYIGVHNAMFNAGITGFFKRMPFDQHHGTLNDCLTELQYLQQIGPAVYHAAQPQPIRDEQWAAMNIFIDALGETISKLRDITGVLADNARGKPGYSNTAYKQAVKDYELSVARYQARG